MTKLEELKAALAAATPGEWINNDDRAPNLATVGTGERGWLGLAQMFGDTDDEANANAKFITLAHNLMPQLLEAVVELGRFVEYLGVAGCDGAYDREIERAVNLLEKLK